MDHVLDVVAMLLNELVYLLELFFEWPKANLGHL